jgi:hypothetical protein
MRDAYREAQARRTGLPAPEPPVETDADPDLAPGAPATPVAAPQAKPEVEEGEPGQLALEGVEPGAEPAPAEFEEPADDDEEPGPPEVSEQQQVLTPVNAGAGIGERIAGVGHEARGALSDGRHWASERWRSAPQVVRHRLAAAAIAVVALVVLLFVLVPAAPCGFPGGDSCPPPDDAIDLVPADAVAYAHADIDPEGDQYAAAAAIADRMPLLSSMALRPFSRLAGGRLDLGSVGSWAGGEAAVALLPAAGSPAAAALIEADDPDAAQQFAESVLGPSASTEDAGGVELTVGARGQASAQVEGFLVIGDEDAVRAIADPPDDAGKLETSAAGDAIDELPDDRLAYAYVSGEGARALFSRPSMRPLNTFVDASATSGVTVALTVEDDVAHLTVRSRLDPDRAQDAPGFFSALPQFAPTLASDVNPDALAYLGLGSPGNSIQSLLSQASTEAPQLRKAYVQAAQQLQKGGGISVAGDLLPLLGTQIALSVEPVAAAAPETPGVVEPAGVPYVSLLAEGVDSEAAAADLAQLQAPLADALVPKSGVVGGRVSAFEPVQIAGTEAQSLPVSRNVELTYATYDDRLAVSTDPLGIAQARAGGDGLADTDSFQRVTAGFPEEVSLIAYLDLRDLLALGEQVGLATDPGYASLAPDLRTLDAAALAVTDDGSEIRTDASLAVGDASSGEVDSTAPPGE